MILEFLDKKYLYKIEIQSITFYETLPLILYIIVLSFFSLSLMFNNRKSERNEFWPQGQDAETAGVLDQQGQFWTEERSRRQNRAGSLLPTLRWIWLRCLCLVSCSWDPQGGAGLPHPTGARSHHENSNLIIFVPKGNIVLR